MERLHRQQDKCQQNEDDQHGPEGLLESEENNTPKRVEDQLKTKMVQGGFYPAVMPSFRPYQAGSNTHHDVQDGPYRSKDPVRRIKERFIQRSVPVAYGTLGCETGKKTHQQTDDNRYAYIEEFSAQ